MSEKPRLFNSDDGLHIYDAIKEVADALRDTLEYCRERDQQLFDRDAAWRAESRAYTIETDQVERAATRKQNDLIMKMIATLAAKGTGGGNDDS